MERERGGDEPLERFVERGVSILVAAVAPDGTPTVCRALACHVAAGGRDVVVLLDTASGGPLLTAIDATGRAAIVFSEPSTHRSIQIKGAGARRVPLPAAATACIADHIDAFVADLARIGFSEAFARALMAHDSDRLAAVGFTIATAFDQTPGPQAGNPVPS